MAKGITGSSHTRYELGKVRSDTMANKYVGNAPKAGGKTIKGKGGKRGC